MLGYLLRILISILLLLFIFSKIPINNIINILGEVNVSFFILSAITSLLAWIISSKKWQILLPNKSFFYLLIQNLLSIIYGLIFAGQLGGELAKIIKVSRSEKEKSIIASSIIADKSSGFLILLIFSFLTLPLTLQHTPSLFTLVLIISILGIIAIITSFFLKYQILNKFLQKNKIIQNSKLYEKFSNLIISYQQFSKPVIFTKTFILSLVFQLIASLCFLFVAKSFNVNLTFIESYWIFSLVSILLFLPISVAGLGIREGSLIFLLAKLGVNTQTALAISLTLFSINLTLGITGLILDNIYVSKKNI